MGLTMGSQQQNVNKTPVCMGLYNETFGGGLGGGGTGILIIYL